MSEIVHTPLGEENVLTQEEFEKQLQNRDTSKYMRQSDGIRACKSCGGAILIASVAHPVWDGPFPMSGSGRCIYEHIPYCRKCDTKPNSQGSPIAPKGSYHNP